jgi:hypothetical protein
MDADLDTLCIAVFRTADDLLPEGPENARRRVTDAEVVTLCVAQAVMGIPSDRHFSRRRPKAPSATSFPSCPSSPASTSAGGGSRTRSSGSSASSPPTAPASQTTSSCSTRRRWRAPDRWRPCADPSSPSTAATATARATRASFGGCACTSRARPTARRGRSPWSRPIGPSARWRFRSCPGCSWAVSRWSATRATRAGSSPSGCASWGAGSFDRRARTSPAAALAPIRQRIESVFWTCKDLLTHERHGARTIENLCVRIATRLLALAACIAHNHRLGRPSRALVDYVA